MARRSADNAIDWDAIERQYRLGKKSNKQLAVEFQVSGSAIGRRADKYGWVADKSEEVDAVTNSLLIQNASGNANPNATPSPAEIKVAAQTNVDVVLGHRTGLKRLRALRDNLTTELEIITDDLENHEKLGELLDESGPDSNGTWRQDKMNERYRRVISLGDRIDNTKKIAEIDEKIRKGEREAFGIDKGESEGNSFDEIVKRRTKELAAG